MTGPITAGPVLVGGGVRVAGIAPVGGVVVGGTAVVPPSRAWTGYEHTQSDRADVWIVDHNLGHEPTAWSLYDDQGRLRDEYLVEHPTGNRAVVRMDTPTAGLIRMI